MASMMDLAVSLTAKTGKFSAGFRSASRTVGSFSSKIRSMGGTVMKFGSILAGVAGVAGFSVMIRKSMQAIDATGKLSDELGISTERLVGFQHAAGLSGTSNETLNKGLQRLVRTLGEAAHGYGEGKKGLDLIGLKASALIKMSPADAMVEIAEKIKLLKSSSERAAAAYGLFGRQGQDLMNFLLMGKSGMAAAQVEAEKLGLTFSRIDAAKVEEANDALLRVKEVFVGMANTITIELSPYIAALAEKFTDAATAGEGMGAKIVSAFEKITLAAMKASSVINRLEGFYYQLETGAKVIATKFQAGLAASGMLGSDPKFSQDESQKWINESAAKANAAYAYAESEAEANARKFFDNIRKTADEKAKATIAAKKKEITGITALENTAATKSAERIRRNPSTEFQVTSLRRFALGGTVGTSLTQRQEVKDTYLGTKIDRLIDIISNRMSAAIFG